MRPVCISCTKIFAPPACTALVTCAQPSTCGGEKIPEYGRSPDRSATVTCLGHDQPGGRALRVVLHHQVVGDVADRPRAVIGAMTMRFCSWQEPSVTGSTVWWRSCTVSMKVKITSGALPAENKPGFEVQSRMALASVQMQGG